MQHELSLTETRTLIQVHRLYMLAVVNNEARRDTLEIFTNLARAAFPGNEKMVWERYEILAGLYGYQPGVIGVVPACDNSRSGM